MDHSEVERCSKEGPDSFTDGGIDKGGNGELAQFRAAPPSELEAGFQPKLAREVFDLCSKLHEIFLAFWPVISATSNVSLHFSPSIHL